MTKSAFILSALLTTAACGQEQDLRAFDREGRSPAVADSDPAIGSTTHGLTASESALQWANDWLKNVKDQPSRLAENVYTASNPNLVAMATGVSASNRTVCGTLITRLLQTTGLTASNFYNSFPKTTTNNCNVGTINNVQYGTNSPDAAQYVYKINSCPTTGVVKFQQRTTVGSVVSGDVLAVSFPERTDISGHVMMVRTAPQVDSGLPAGPAGSTAYAVQIIDSTSTPHGTSTTYPDNRPGPNGAANNQGLGTGTFVLYANANGAIVATRWSPTDPTFFTTSDHPVAIGGAYH